jgi:hypothetical protein
LERKEANKFSNTSSDMAQFTISLSVFLIAAAGLAAASPLSASSVPQSYGFRVLEGMEDGLYHG